MTYSDYGTDWFVSSSSTYINFLLEILYRGLDGETSTSNYLSGKALPNSAAKAVEMVEDLGWTTYQSYMNEAWEMLVSYYNDYLAKVRIKAKRPLNNAAIKYPV